MIYKSTRGKSPELSVAGAIIKGIADDKGLYVPENFPKLTKSFDELSGMTYKQVCYQVLAPYFTGFSEADIQNCIDGAYDGKFEAEDVAPLKEAGGAHFLELYHGRTAAFKDMALSMLPYLLTTSVRLENEDKTIVILVSTSGDTGMAALKGFEDVPGTEIFVFFPENGVSPVQERQMRTATGGNTHVYSIYGNFDDAQTTQKRILNDKAFGEKLFEKGYKFTAANSMNIGRLLPQVAYYVWAYAGMVKSGAVKAGDPINITVPSGNFGNILSAYYASKMGVPVNKFICASNKNNVLADFLSTGTYDARRDLYVTNAPSMDIIISSNLERLLYHLSGDDAGYVSSLMDSLENDRCYTVNETVKNALDAFRGGFATEDEIEDAIGDMFRENGYVMDTHTAVAYKVWKDYTEETGDKTPTVIASTASPYKFAAAVSRALGLPKDEDDFAAIERLHKATGVDIPSGLNGLDKKRLLHKDVIEKEAMAPTVEAVLTERTK